METVIVFSETRQAIGQPNCSALVLIYTSSENKGRAVAGGRSISTFLIKDYLDMIFYIYMKIMMFVDKSFRFYHTQGGRGSQKTA